MLTGEPSWLQKWCTRTHAPPQVPRGQPTSEGRQAGDLFSGRAATNATKQAGQGPFLSALARLLRHNVYGISRLLAPSCKEKTSQIGKFVGSHA